MTTTRTTSVPRTGSARLVVADDHALVRAGICSLLAGHEDLVVVGEADDGATALGLVLALEPDLVLMDLRMPELDGVEATREIVASHLGRDRRTRVLVLTTFDDDQSVHAALAAGASGFLVKDTAPRLLLPAVRSILAGRSWLDPVVADQVVRTIQSVPQRGTAGSELVARLTEREQEVLVQMARGRSNGQISTDLVLSPATVRTHVSRILMKTGCRDRTQAVVLAYATGLVRPPRS